jgi:predicted acyltransferase
MSLEIAQAPAGKRLLSLDLLRGVDIAFMILVNNGGMAPYHPLTHTVWNGWTPTDLVFPTFLFIMGVSMRLSFTARMARGEKKSTLLAHVFRRFVILFLLGLVVNGFPFFPLHTLRIYGVLQRIAICYLLASLLELWTASTRIKIAVTAVCLVGYWVLLRYVPVPGYGVPGHAIPFMDMNRNIVSWLDRRIFPGRLYVGTRDPEGLLSDIPAVGSVLLGMLTGTWLQSARTLEQKCRGMLLAGIAGITLGELWSLWFPMNKNLWTSSFVLFAAGCGSVLFALLYWMVEIKGWRGGWTYFWLVFGTNAITAYVFSELLASTLSAIHMGPKLAFQRWMYLRTFAHIHPPGVGSLVYSIIFVLVCWLPMLVLYRKKIFLKV